MIDIIFYYETAISYNILYAKVFKLPDVAYSVERMLHDPIDYEICYQEIKSENDDYYDRICLSDGRYFELDRPCKKIYFFFFLFIG